MENPFLGYGTYVYGERFVGRSLILQDVTRRFTGDLGNSNVALVGPPKVGKSSIAWHCLVLQRSEFAARKKLVCWQPFGRLRTPVMALQAMVHNADRERRRLGIVDPQLSAAAHAVRTESDWLELNTLFDDFFFRLTALGWKTLFVLDEFDHARNVFKDDPSGFQALREPGQNPDYGVSYVTCSRRPLVEIEKQVGRGLSDFHNIFNPQNVPLFGRSEMAELIARVPRSVSFDLLGAVMRRTGGHPFLAAQLLYAFCESSNMQEASFDAAWRSVRETFVRYYDDLNRQLDTQGRLSSLKQIVFGPQIDVTRHHAEDLVRYSVLHRSPRGDSDAGYESFSTDYEDYLRILHRERPLWPLWSETEIRLRCLVNETLSGVYQMADFWTEMARRNPTLSQIVKRAGQIRAREERAFGGRASGSLADYTYPADLWAIITRHWSSFVVVLRRDKAYWNERFRLISIVRNPLAHSRDPLEGYQRGQAVEYCEELLAVLRVGASP